MLKVRLNPCLRCLQVCPNCRSLPLERRRDQARVALWLLGFRPTPDDPPDSGDDDHSPGPPQEDDP